MSNVLNKPISLSLNKHWRPVNIRTIGSAIVDLCSSSMKGDRSCFALDIDFDVDENGEIDFNNAKTIRPVEWNEWITLPVREWEFGITSPRMTIRAPLVTVAVNYTEMPVKLFRKKPNNEGIWMRDKGICQYTGKKLNRHESSVDHVKPRSRGGKDTWTNMVLCDKKLNFEKGNKLNEEIGLKLIRNPTIPRTMSAFETINEAKHVSWNPFLFHNK